MRLQLDDWQKRVMETLGNQVIRSGRQSGKSTVISIYGAEYAVKHQNKTILIIASVERQALLLFEKVFSHLYENYKTYIAKGKDKPTKHKVTLTNGSVIHCLPTGLSGYGIRGYTIDLLIADEAAFIPEEVWTAVTPMMAITKGNIILLSTPFGKGGYFYRCFSDPTFTSSHVSTEDCPRRDEVFLAQEKERMTKIQYAQEYLGEFVDELMQFFPTQLIMARASLAPERGLNFPSPPSGDYYQGVDIARMGGDESVMLTLEQTRNKNLTMKDMLVTKNSYLTETAKLIKDADSKYNYRKIYIDDGGLGVGVFDMLLEDEQTGRKVIAINNASRGLERDKKGKRKKLLKEDLYNNLLSLMEQGKIEFWKDPDLILSLKSVQSEYVNGKLRIFGNYTHITEALIRAAWCTKDKRLNIWIA